MLKRDIGNKGEDFAVKKLKKLGYKIIQRNFNANIGEIDIIAKDKDYLCFIEVRMRKSTSYGSGAETVDIFKQRKIIKAAQVYLKVHKLEPCLARFDVVSITGDGGKDSEFELIRDAFSLPEQKF